MSTMSLSILGWWDNRKPQKILGWARRTIQEHGVSAGDCEPRLTCELDSTVHAAIIRANGDVVATRTWDFLHSRPREFEVWFQGQDHARMRMTEAVPQPAPGSS